MVAVFEFQVWDNDAGTHAGPCKGTAAFIKTAGGEIVPGTEEDVEAGQLTPEGQYDPLPLGPDVTDLA